LALPVPAASTIASASRTEVTTLPIHGPRTETKASSAVGESASEKSKGKFVAKTVADRLLCEKAEAKGLLVRSNRGPRHGWQWHDKLVMSVKKQDELVAEVRHLLTTASCDDEKALQVLEKSLRQLFGGCSLFFDKGDLKARSMSRLVNSYQDDDPRFGDDYFLHNTRDAMAYLRQGGLDKGRTVYRFSFDIHSRDNFRLPQ
jgi:hypothetical protein